MRGGRSYGWALAVLCTAGVVDASAASPDLVQALSQSAQKAPVFRAPPVGRPLVGVGPRLLSRYRLSPPTDRVRFLARGLTRAKAAFSGAQIVACVGPICSVEAPLGALPQVAALATYLELPQPLRPALDVSRQEIGVEDLDRGVSFGRKVRGAETLVAIYDSGLDLAHPDFRDVDGPSRVIALWDQAATGTPPVGFTSGDFCSRDRIVENTCPARDVVGHGTHIASIAVSGGPQFRGMAPEAGIVVARSDDFTQLVEALTWFDQVATDADRPLVVNLSLTGHEGPHDGSSLEAQAIDAFPHPVVLAAGNEGTFAVHSLARLEKGDFADLALRFDRVVDNPDRVARVEVWGDAGLPVEAQVVLVDANGNELSATSSIGVGDPGSTQLLLVEGRVVGSVALDAEADFNPFNGQGHLRLEVQMLEWQDAPRGFGYAVVRLRGEGRIDAWVDAPASEPSPPRFDRDRVLGSDNQILGDSDHTISDPATAAAGIAVAAYTSRVTFEDLTGETVDVAGELGSISSFTSWGPTIAPSATGDKPDLAAPGLLVIGSKSLDAAAASGDVSNLYLAAAGTSVAAPHVAGVAALLYSVRPNLTREEIKEHILRSATRDEAVEASLDPRWGAGKLDANAAVGRILEKDGCTCQAPQARLPRVTFVLILLGFGLILRRQRRA